MMLRTLLPVALLLGACGAEPMIDVDEDPQSLVAALDGSLVLPTNADTFARDAFPAHVYGADASLEVKKYDSGWNRTAYLRFDTSRFDASFTQVTLRAYGSYGQSPIAVAVHGTSANWSESTLSWSNRPALSGGPLASQTVSSSTPRWYEWDVTAYVRAQKALGQPAVGFALESLTYGNGIATFASKESGPNGAQLVVSGSSPNPAPTLVTPVQVSQNPVTGPTVALSALGADDAGEANLTYTWSATYDFPVPVAFSVNGTNAAKSTVATFSRAGTYQVSVSIADANGASVTNTRTVEVVQTPTTLRIIPEDRTVFAGTTSGFVYDLLDQFGTYIILPPPAVFSVSGGGTMTSGGAFTSQAVSGGPFTVTATAAGITAQTTVTVYEGSPAQLLPLTSDAYVRSGIYANRNFGAEAQLIAKQGTPDYTRKTLLSVDLSSIPEAGTVRTARLRFHAATDSASSMWVSLRSVTDPWSELGVTWQNQPATSAHVSAFTTYAPGYDKQWYAVDLTDFVRAEHAAGHSMVSLELSAYTPDRYLAIDSRESEFPPRLEVQFGFEPF
ncbi:MAG: DNRLRE domain-containing protein [Myxococcales bacterium]|nr:MAG: DNRLRE domain-containing protein [Myxococcales bacterium]